MATLNTLRTKFGIVLSVVIALALLAFIFSLKSEMGFSGSDPIVATVDGQNVSYSEYLAKYENIREMNGIDGSNEQQLDALSNAALQSFVNDLAIEPGFEKLGINTSDNERTAMISGEIATQAFYGAFADPSTGMYDNNAVTMFLLQSGGNPQAEAAWSYINNQARMERESSKYIALIGAGAYVNDLEVKREVAMSNSQSSGRWATQRYSTLADSLYTISSAEIKKYYDNNLARFKKSPARALSYVAFDIVATVADKKEIESNARKAGEGFAVAEDLRAFVRDNRSGNIASAFSSASQLLEEEAAAFAKGEMYGPILRNNTWRISRPLDTRMAPDSLGIRIIALPYTSTALADSLLVALQGGANFAEAAAQHSLHTQTAQMGGEVGVIPFSVLTIEMADALKGAKENTIVKVEVGDVIQILQSYNLGKSSAQYRVAAIEYPVIASQATINKAHADAALFVTDAKDSKTSFEAAATKHEMTAMSTSLTREERTIPVISNSSREIARWAHGAKKGDLSQIFKVDNGYVVAMLKDIDDSEYTSLENATSTIRFELLKDKKFEAIKSELKGTTFNEAEKSLKSTGIKTFENVSASANFISGMGVEARVIGAIASTTEVGKLSEPVKGNSGLYIFEVTTINEVEEPLTADAMRVRLQSSASSRAQQMVFSAIEQLSSVEDLRGMYF